MKYVYPTLFIAWLILSCGKDDNPCLQPCIASIIADIAQHHCDSTANISQYKLKGEYLYVIDPGFCAFDQAYDVINKDCEVIGYLQGFAGNHIINGVDFYDNAKLVAVIWKE